MIRRNIPKITGHDLRMSMLATLDDEDAARFVGKQALEQDDHWIEAARDAGAFDPSGDAIQAFAFGMPNKDLSRSVAMVDALLRFVEGTTTTLGDNDPEYGRLDQPTTIFDFSFSDAFRDAYANVVERWIGDADRVGTTIQQNGLNAGKKAVEAIEHSLGLLATKLMVGAIVLDESEVLGNLIRAFPESLDHSLKPSNLIDCLNASIISDGVSLTPYGFALQYGRSFCMTQIEEATRKDCPVVGRLEVGNRPFNATQLQGVMVPLCYPSVLADAMRLCFERDPDIDKSGIAKEAIEALAVEPSDKRFQMWPAYLDLGIYELDAPAAFEQAVTHAHLPVIESFEGRVPWAEIDDKPDSSILVRVLDHQSINPSGPEQFKAVERMVSMAKADGALDGVMRLVPKAVKGLGGSDTDYGPVLVEPIANLIDQSHQNVLHELLKHTGLKPGDAPAPGAWTLQKMANECNASIADFFRSYTARTRAHDLIDEIDSAPSFTKGIAP